MIFFLDFDRTIFDFDSFRDNVLSKNEKAAHYLHEVNQFKSGTPERQEAWLKIGNLIESGEIHFDKSSFPEFVFKDAIHFFKKNHNNIVIVTVGHKAFQSLKVENCLDEFSWMDTLYVQKGLKGPVIRDYLKEKQDEAIFVDDSPVQLESVMNENIGIKIYEMRRDNIEPDKRFKTLRNFDDLKI